MEDIEVHSKNFLIRWVHAEHGGRVSWCVVPVKRSINFGVFARNFDGVDGHSVTKRFSQAPGSLLERLAALGFVPIAEHKDLRRVDSKQAEEGSATVKGNQLVAFVFDNTFSVSYSKHVQLTFSVEPPWPLVPPPPPQPDHKRVLAAAAASAALYKPDARAPSGPRQRAASFAVNRKPSATFGSPPPAALNPNPSGSTHAALGVPPATASVPNLGERSPSPAVQSASSVVKSSSVAVPRGAEGGKPVKQDSSPAQPALSPVATATRSELFSPPVVGLATAPSEASLVSVGSAASAASQPEPRASSSGSALTGPVITASAPAAQPNAPASQPAEVPPSSAAAALRRPQHVEAPMRPSRHNTLSSVHSRSDAESVSSRSGLRRRSTLTSSDGELSVSADGRYVAGYLQKKRRKQFQGFAKRYFQLDRQTGLLNYYLNNRSSSLRGVMPVKIADMTVIRKSHIIQLDSGMENWSLKANDNAAFEAWRAEFNAIRAADTPEGDSDEPHQELAETERSIARAAERALEQQSVAEQVRTLVGQLGDSPQKSQLLELCADLKPTHQSSQPLPPPARVQQLRAPLNVSLIPPTRVAAADSAVRDLVKEYVFLLLVCVAVVLQTRGLRLRALLLAPLTACVLLLMRKLADLGNFKDVFDFLTSRPTLTEVKEVLLNIRAEPPQPLSPETSTEDDQFDISDDDDDAKDEIAYVTHVPAEQPSGAVTSPSQFSSASTDNEDTGSATPPASAHTVLAADSVLAAASSLYPLPHAPVSRRHHIRKPKEAPPSLMALLKQAKDSNAGAPVTANEPLSALESCAELLESAKLLDAASHAAPRSVQRVMLVATFAVSRLSGMRCRERALRKPFTPLLGETYECVREDRNFRFVSEKVMHKPEVFAMQAESPLWTLHFTSRPHTKMWPKTVQLTDAGHVSVAFPDGERVTYLNPEVFVRNIYVGERYVEPSGRVLVESSLGKQALVEFKSGGMFSGRAEEVRISCEGTVYEGKWTERIVHSGKTVWTAPPLMDEPTKHYGFPLFAVQLNEVTELERGQLPPNDSRLRPDLRMYENQELDEAQKTKLYLEQQQRVRRKQLADAQKVHTPMFFVKSADATGNYVLMRGEGNYWVRRKQGGWASIPNFFDLHAA